MAVKHTKKGQAYFRLRKNLIHVRLLFYTIRLKVLTDHSY
jgi:hypothetical protein